MNLETVAIKSLLTANNSQLLARVNLVRAILNETGIGFSWNLYSEVHKYSDPTSRSFGEDNSKFSLGDYLFSTLELVRSISREGYDPESNHPIRVTTGGIVLDGAHRLAILLLTGEEFVQVKVEKGAGETGLKVQRLSSGGLSSIHREALEMEMLLGAGQISAVVFFGFDSHESKRLMSGENGDSCTPIAAFHFGLTETGRARLVNFCYGANEWFTPELGHQMMLERFMGQGGSASIYFMPSSSGDILKLKSAIRNKTKGFERRIHSTDCLLDAYRLLTFATTSGRHWANHAPLGSEDKFLDERGGNLKLRPSAGLDASSFFSGSTVLELYGQREATDRDILHAGHPHSNTGIIESSHSKHLSTLGVDAGDLLGHPLFSFFLEGDRILSPWGACHLYSHSLGEEASKEKFALATNILINSDSQLLAYSSKRTGVLRMRILGSRLYERAVSLLPGSLRPLARATARRVGKLVFGSRDS